MPDDPVRVEIEFSPDVTVSQCELIVRRDGKSIGSFRVDIQERESSLKDSHTYNGYPFKLAPSALAESYLQVDLEGVKDRFLIPFLRFIPERHIKKELREASPDFREEVSVILTQTWMVPPTFLSTDEDVEASDPFEDPTGKTGKEILEEQGVSFPSGAAYFYGLPTAQIAVKNTEDNLEKIEQYVKSLTQ